MPLSRQAFQLSPNLIDKLRDGLAAHSASWPFACILDSCGLEDTIFSTGNQNVSLLAGFGGHKSSTGQQILSKTALFAPGNWYFGNLNYENKDQTEPGLTSTKPRTGGFADDFFFEAEEVYKLSGNQLEIFLSSDKSHQQRLDELLKDAVTTCSVKADIVQVFPLDRYLEQAGKLHQHLLRGDIYEINYCIPFTTEAEIENIPSLWRKLNAINPAPFSACYKHHDSWLLCASPERFLRKSGNKLFSQPIKGTARRGKTSQEDAQIAAELCASEKERAENIMITDLVRNDLSRIATKGSVKVEELCGLYSYRHVFQLISTISAEVKNSAGLADILHALFPMGSMTGAPKFRAMQLIEEAEDFRRELFSGSVGYISPEGDFDFNVVIRSILYNRATKHLTIPAGSALTVLADHKSEYEECLLKANALLRLIDSHT